MTRNHLLHVLCAATPLQGSAIGGFVVLGSPATDACSPLKARSDKWASSSPILLAMQGNCSAETKVRNGQAAGFTAIIIYNNESGSNVTTSEYKHGILTPFILDGWDFYNKTISY